MSVLEKGTHQHCSIVRIGSGAHCDLGDRHTSELKN
jgi:hypothetical protein